MFSSSVLQLLISVLELVDRKGCKQYWLVITRSPSLNILKEQSETFNYNICF